MKVNAFIVKTRQLFNELAKHRIVIGNQAADLDSIVSAISMSFFLTSTSQTTDSYLPVINSNRKVLQSKKECMYLFDYFSINLDDLLFISDFESKTITDVTLVDHCELDEQEKSKGFADLITRVIDHHLDKNFFLNANPRIIDTTAGSNATLVTDLIRSSNFQLNESFSSMLIFPILFDTNKLTNRASQKDHDMVKYLRELSNLNCDSVYARLDEIRFSAGADEDTNTILSKDYKQYTTINDIKWAMSSVTIEVKDWLKAEEKLNEIKAFMAEKDLQFFGILSIFKKQNGEFSRDLGLFTTNSNFLYELNQKSLDSNLSLNKIVKIEESFAYSVYDVSQVNLTRKYWQPFLENFLKNL